MKLENLLEKYGDDRVLAAFEALGIQGEPGEKELKQLEQHIAKNSPQRFPKARKTGQSKRQPPSPQELSEPPNLKGDALAKTQEESQAAQGGMVAAKQRTIAAIKAVNQREGEADAQLGLAAYTQTMLQTQADGYNDIADSMVASLEAFDTIRDATYLDENSDDLLQLPAVPRSQSRAKAGFSLNVGELKTKLNQQLEALEAEEEPEALLLEAADDEAEEGSDADPFDPEGEDAWEMPEDEYRTNLEPYLKDMLTSLPSQN